MTDQTPTAATGTAAPTAATPTGAVSAPAGQPSIGTDPLTPDALKGRVALVTGASSGIGRAIALELARCGASVGVNYHSEQDEANEVVGAIEQAGGQAVAVGGNVGVSAEVDAMFEALDKRFGAIDILVNNSGIEKSAPFVDIAEQDWDRVIDVNLKGAFLCGQQAARRMIGAGRGGRIVNVSSVHEDLGFPGFTPYVASKGGLMMLMRNMALELAQYGITVVNVGPGAIATPINEKMLADPAQVLATERQIPLGRIGQPEDVARLVAFLASNAGGYITGTTVFIDGGLMRAATSH